MKSKTSLTRIRNLHLRASLFNSYLRTLNFYRQFPLASRSFIYAGNLVKNANLKQKNRQENSINKKKKKRLL